MTYYSSAVIVTLSCQLYNSCGQIQWVRCLFLGGGAGETEKTKVENSSKNELPSIDTTGFWLWFSTRQKKERQIHLWNYNNASSKKQQRKTYSQKNLTRKCQKRIFTRLLLRTSKQRSVDPKRWLKEFYCLCLKWTYICTNDECGSVIPLTCYSIVRIKNQNVHLAY